MKALEWQRLLNKQHKQYGKVIFSITELANLVGTTPHILNVELERLVSRGVLVRYAPGKYGLPDIVTFDNLVPTMDSSAYITAMAALYRHGLITQVPTETVCFTNRRHNRSRERRTALGKLVFVCVSPRIYAPPREGIVASREQALCDFIHWTRQNGLDAPSLVTFRNLEQLDRKAADSILNRYPKTVVTTVYRVLEMG